MSFGEFKSNADVDTSADIPPWRTYPCDLCDKSARSNFYSFNDLRRHKEAKHEIIDRIQEASSAVPKEAVSKTASLFREPSTPSDLPKQNAASSAKGDAPFQCPKCDSKFIRKHTLTNHLRTHIVAREHHQQFICEAPFARQDTLTSRFRSKKGLKELDFLRPLQREKLQTVDGSGLLSDDNLFADQAGENADILLNAGKTLPDTNVRDADCPVGPKADFICATAEQLRKLGRRSVHQTDRDNWNAIYKTLFPDDPLPESPYLDPLVSYEVNLIREAFLTAAPVAVRTAIQHVIPEELSDTLQEELERILRSTHAEVFDQILRRMREDRESPRVDRTTTQSSSQVRVSSTPDSGIGSTIRSGSSQDELELTLNSQDRLTSFGSGSFDLQNDGSNHSCHCSHKDLTHPTIIWATFHNLSRLGTLVIFPSI
ncbi:hypothetical protein IFM53868_06901 [Aspergillus udagawae]|uniref:C2H2-type domain-containing protein n=1 Tax=Aspergillus udagawae TaxID=91492 RepID=A0ABQ1B3E6_9EURO|nr:hypothetical protein IFM53868_06901 [Aspergillus udagawae]